jgi:hypothetical protein
VKNPGDKALYTFKHLLNLLVEHRSLLASFIAHHMALRIKIYEGAPAGITKRKIDPRRP